MTYENSVLKSIPFATQMENPYFKLGGTLISGAASRELEMHKMVPITNVQGRIATDDA